MTAYDSNNIFAKILRGELPCHKVYEDEHVFAFLDIMPRVPGHTLVIPKAPARNVFDIPPEDFAAVARTTLVHARSRTGRTVRQQRARRVRFSGVPPSVRPGARSRRRRGRATQRSV